MCLILRRRITVCLGRVMAGVLSEKPAICGLTQTLERAARTPARGVAQRRFSEHLISRFPNDFRTMRLP